MIPGGVTLYCQHLCEVEAEILQHVANEGTSETTISSRMCCIMIAEMEIHLKTSVT
jgi:hypothetical protein